MPIGAFKLNSISKYLAPIVTAFRTARTITANGNAQVSTAQSRFGGTSLVCDGTGDYLTCANGSDISFGSSSFTIEYWLRFNVVGNLYVPIASRGGASIFNGEWWCEVTAAEKKMYWGFKNTAGTQYYVNVALAGTAFVTGQWYHIALVKNGTSMQQYIDGTAVGTSTTVTGSFGGVTDVYVGALGPGGYSLNGWIDEVRISNSARYTANFTSPTSALIDDSNTLLLIHAHGNNASTTFRDDNGIRLVRNVQTVGNAQISTTQSKFGGASVYMDGTGDYLKILFPAALGSGDFTIEAWIYPTTVSGIQVIYDDRTVTSDSTKILFYMNGTTLYYYATGNHITGTSAIPTANTWYHVAVSRSGTTVKMFVNGTQVGSNYTDSATKSNNSYNACLFGQNSESALAGGSIDHEFTGYMDDIRISNSARYTSNFTAPTSAFTNDSNTLLLIHGDGTNASTDIFDDNS